MNEIQIFNSEIFGTIRTAGTPDNPLFCLSDLCRVLDLNTSKVAQRLEKGVLSKYPLSTNGGIQELNFVNEDGLYDVILDSRKQEAKAFRKWVTGEVLPSIRKTGSYSIPSDYLSALKALVASEEEKQRLALENTTMKPKAEYYDALVDRKCLLNFTDTAKELKIGRTALINILLENKWIYRNNGKDLRPYAKYVEKGYFEMKEFHNENRSNTQTLITVAGRDAIMNKLLNVKIK